MTRVDLRRGVAPVRTQTVMTRPGPKSRVERMHNHANRLRTGPCRQGRCDWWMTRDGFRCRRCDEPYEVRWDAIMPPVWTDLRNHLEGAAQDLGARMQTIADGWLRSLAEVVEPIDLTAPVKHILVQPGTFPPLFPAVDIHPNGGIPG